MGTLIDSDNNPIPENILLLSIFQKLNCKIIVWSGGGKEYADEVIKRLKLANITTADKGSLEPHITFDDAYCRYGKVNIMV